MPQIVVKGVQPDEMSPMSKTLAPKLAQICDCPSDWFVFDHIPSAFFDETGSIPHWPVVQVWWFARPQEMQDRVAVLLNDYLKGIGYSGTQISFHIFENAAYYEDGAHY